MANFNFQGESDLSEKQINFICEVLEKHGFVGSKVTIGNLGKAGDNYGSNVKTITAEREDGKSLKMVAKVAPPPSDIFRKMVNIEIVFKNESAMYDKILPKFRQLELEADIPVEDRLNIPICYGILSEELHEVILLEDLQESDFVMKDRFKSMTDKEIRVTVNSLAKLHSLSFVLKSNDLSTYEEFTSQLTDYFTTSTTAENIKTNFTVLEDKMNSLFDVDRYKDKIRGCMTNVANEAHKLRRCDVGSKQSVIVHGDSWTNNILWKLNNDGSPEECMLIDYQLSTERSPVYDLLYLIFGCTDFQTRSKYYESWIDEYHEKLEKYLSHYGVKVNYVYSKERMLADLKRYSKFFLGWSILISNAQCLSTEDAAKFKDALNSTENADEIMETIKTENVDSITQTLLKTKIQGIIDSYYDLGYCS